MNKILFLSQNDIRELIRLEEIIPLIEEGFRQDALSQIRTFPVIRETLDNTNGIFGIKSGYLKKERVLGFKAGGYWINNPGKGLAGHQSLIVLYDPETGISKSVMDGNLITILRTGAAGAIAVKYLARKNASRVGVIGTGMQGRIQTLALRAVCRIERVIGYDSNRSALDEFCSELGSYFKEVKKGESAQETVQDSDIVITATPSYRFIVQSEWIKPGMHINAIGADTHGKQELEPTIFQKAKTVVDNLSQSKTLGECQHALGLGLLTESDIYAELGEIVLGKKPGRVSADEITLFDATGVAFQDLITAGLAYDLALRKNAGRWFSF